MIRIDHFNDSTIAETVSLLNKGMGKSKIIAGGSDLVDMMKNRLITPEAFFSSSGFRVRRSYPTTSLSSS